MLKKISNTIGTMFIVWSGVFLAGTINETLGEWFDDKIDYSKKNPVGWKIGKYTTGQVIASIWSILWFKLGHRMNKDK